MWKNGVKISNCKKGGLKYLTVKQRVNTTKCKNKIYCVNKRLQSDQNRNNEQKNPTWLELEKKQKNKSLSFLILENNEVINWNQLAVFFIWFTLIQQLPWVKTVCNHDWAHL